MSEVSGATILLLTILVALQTLHLAYEIGYKMGRMVEKTKIEKQEGK